MSLNPIRMLRLGTMGALAARSRQQQDVQMGQKISVSNNQPPTTSESLVHQPEVFQELEEYLPDRGKCLLITSRMSEPARRLNFKLLNII